MSSDRVNGPYDVVVIGGGPGGAALAILLQESGHRCLILEQIDFPRYHIGESLIPQTYPTLKRIGVLDELYRSHFPVKHSVRFVAESGQESDPFYFSETIEGPKAQTWQVERSEFDTMCLNHARKRGVDVLQPARVDSVLFENDRAVGVQAQELGQPPFQVSARVVVDASGRGTVIGNQLDLKQPVPGLDKASLWSYYRGARRRSGIDAGETTVFMIPQRGWFWYIPLPNDIVSVGVVASPQYLFDTEHDFEPVFLREVQRCAPLREFIGSATREAPVRGLRRLAYRNRQIAGPGWVMIGDAAAFLDPIYSSGLFLALGSAEMAADCIHGALTSGDLSASRLGGFVPSLLEGVEVVRRLIFAFYDPDFSFRAFVDRFPEQRAALINCLIGDVVNRDMSSFLSALNQMTPSAV